MTLRKKHFANVMDDKHAIEQSHRDGSRAAAVGGMELGVLTSPHDNRSIIWICNLNLIFTSSKSQK